MEDSVQLEPDDGRRSQVGVVVTLLDLGDGTSRVVLDDVRSDDEGRDTSWRFDCFYTHKRLDSSQVDHMTLPVGEYTGLGEAILARLLALNGRVK
jgi:hypothetical protein